MYADMPLEYPLFYTVMVYLIKSVICCCLFLLSALISERGGLRSLNRSDDGTSTSLHEFIVIHNYIYKQATSLYMSFSKY